jgi:two-component system, OmpR family, phosphate regulon sensor histidine kinase PhoR
MAVLNSKDIQYFIFVQVIYFIIMIAMTAPLIEGVFAILWIGYSVYFFKGILKKQKQVNLQQSNEVKYQVGKALDEVESSNLKLSKLVNTLAGGVILIDEKGFIKMENQTFLSMFNLESLMNQEYHLLEKIKPLFQTISEAFTAEVNKRVQIKNHERFFDLIMTPIFDDSVFEGLLILINDITEIKIAEQFQKQFTADVSHELKTPLSAILGMTEIMINSTVNPDKQKEFLKTLHEEAVRLEKMIKDLLIISKLDRIDLEFIKKPTSIKTLVEKSSRLLQPQVERKNLQLITQVEDHTIMLEEQKFHQVLVNILSNALQYTDKGSITILGKKLKNHYQLKVIDTGIGISEEHLPFVFKRFYRVDSARSRESGGTGLGLSIVKNVVVKHGGQIQVTSQIKQGTTFTILLPI